MTLSSPDAGGPDSYFAPLVRTPPNSDNPSGARALPTAGLVQSEPANRGRLVPSLGSMIVTVDGPGGTGKSTVSRVLAYKTGLPHLDTGAFYRAATLAVLSAGVDPSIAGETARVVDDARFDQSDGRMYLDGEDVSDEIRGEEVTAHVSVVSSHPAVREIMVGLQRDWVARHDGNGVVEGRDIGTVVFPDAEVKVFLDARPEVRALRRANETGESLDEVLADLRRRDHFDSTREASPMSIPPDAILFDTSDLDFDEVVEHLYALITAKS